MDMYGKVEEKEEHESSELEGTKLLADMFSAIEGINGVEFVPKPNIADMFDTDTLLAVGRQCKEGYEADQDSMADWSELVDFGLELVKQETKPKSTPWDGAANFKSPELMKAALKFSDRASSELLRGYDILKTKVIGKDPQNVKLERGERVSEFQNWQLNVEMPEWIDEHKKLIYDIPYTGTVFKKTFFDAQLGRPTSKLICYPNFSVSQDATSISRLRRFSEIHDFSKNEIIEKQRQGVWLEDAKISFGDRDDETDQESDADKFTSFIEQDGYYDLDKDGYEEPYTVVFQESTGVVVRIIPRFEPKDVLIKDEKTKQATTLDMAIQTEVMDRELEVVRITPEQNVTKYDFLSDPQGGFLGVGYTHLLSAIVASINTTTNQLVDAGTLSNLQGGWLARGFRRKMGTSGFKPGEWKQTQISAIDLQNGIRPLPFKEPSPTLLALMQFMIGSAQELAASADLKGALGANAPVGTMLAMVDDQMQGTSAIVKGLYRSMSLEFRKLFILNSKFTDPAQYQSILDDPQADFAQDFNLRGMDIVPTANPEIATKTQRIIQANAEVAQAQLVALTGGDIKPIMKNFFEAIGSSVGDEVYPEETPEQLLQELLSRNPQLEQMIMGEKERLDLIARAQAASMEEADMLRELEVLSKVDQSHADIQYKKAKAEVDQQQMIIKAEQEDEKAERDAAKFVREMTLKMTELEQKYQKQLDGEYKSNEKLMIYDPAVGDFV